MFLERERERERETAQKNAPNSQNSFLSIFEERGGGGEGVWELNS